MDESVFGPSSGSGFVSLSDEELVPVGLLCSADSHCDSSFHVSEVVHESVDVVAFLGRRRVNTVPPAIRIARAAPLTHIQVSPQSVEISQRSLSPFVIMRERISWLVQISTRSCTSIAVNSDQDFFANAGEEINADTKANHAIVDVFHIKINGN